MKNIKTISLLTMTLRQLLPLRDEVYWARDDLAKGGQPPHGFDLRVASGLESIAFAFPTQALRCRPYASLIRSRRAEKWIMQDMDLLIDCLDTALREFSRKAA